MIQLLLKAIDRLIDLARISNKRTKARFDEVLAPAFVELQCVRDDYLVMFTDLAVRIGKIPPGADCTHPLARDAVEFLTQRRVVQLAVRNKLRALAGLKDSPAFSSPERTLILIILMYLHSAGALNSEADSLSFDLLTRLKMTLGMELSDDDRELDARVDARQPAIPLANLARLCESRCSMLERDWDRVVRVYNDLKLEVIQTAV